MATSKSPKTVEEYIAQFPAGTQKLLKQIRKTMRAELPNADEVISYGIATFKLNGKAVIYFAGFKDHVSVYPIPQGSAAFQKQVEKYQTGRGTLQFPLDKPLPLAFIRNATQYRLKATLAKSK
jgi:uncharacterized protein YdhG (YjbR/CyaY superfamily)